MITTLEDIIENMYIRICTYVLDYAKKTNNNK